MANFGNLLITAANYLNSLNAKNAKILYENQLKANNEILKSVYQVLNMFVSGTKDDCINFDNKIMEEIFKDAEFSFKNYLYLIVNGFLVDSMIWNYRNNYTIMSAQFIMRYIDVLDNKINMIGIMFNDGTSIFNNFVEVKSNTIPIDKCTSKIKTVPDSPSWADMVEDEENEFTN